MLYDGPRRNEQECPHIIEMQVPSTGLGNRLNDMHDWHRTRLLEARRGHGRTDVEDRAAFGGAAVTRERSKKYGFWS
jgi:hypothetical protein